MKPLAFSVLEGIVHVLLLVGVLNELEHLVIGEVVGWLLGDGITFLGLSKDFVVVLKIFESDIAALGHLSKDISQFLFVF